MKRLLALCLLLSGCCRMFPSWTWMGGCPGPCGRYLTLASDVTAYEFAATATTAGGISVDASINVDLAALERRVRAIDSCVQRQATKIPSMTDKQKLNWGCVGQWQGGPIQPLKLDCLRIKVVPSVASKCQSDWQLLPDRAPDAACIAKGLHPTADCPCRWRTVLQGDRTVVTPPAMYLWPVVQMMTGCSNFWASPLAECAVKGLGY